MILDALSEKVDTVIVKDDICPNIIEICEKFNLNEFLIIDNEVFDFDEEYVPDIIW